MAIEIPAKLVEFILLGPEGDRRQLQDSPLLGDVWLALAKEPGKRLELLISPYKEQPAGKLAATLAGELEKKAQQSAKAPRRKGAKRAREAADEANVAYLQGIVAASLDVTSILEFIVPKTDWWARHYTDLRRYFTDPKALEPAIDHIYEEAMEWQSGAAPGKRAPTAKASAYQRYVALAALLLWAEDASHSLDAETAGEAAAKLTKAMATVGAPKTGETPWIWNVFLNRTATPAVAKSVPAVKGDAARSLFHVDCSKIVWAVVDSGVAGDHQAFQGKDRSRVLRSFDFTRIREIVSLSNQSEERAQAQAARLVREELLEKPRLDTARSHLKRLAADAEEGRRIDWGLVEPFIEIKVETPPHANHGTHVAGILGAGILGAGILGAGGPEAQGMCPDIGIYDLRVLGPTLAETEFAIIAALQYIRYLNARNSYPTVHGANLSLSIPHEVRNFGCGHTPVCEECERLVNSGVVVVAAAGNRGYQHYETSEGRFDSYAASSITDPGNGDSVITVGSTHRFSPHTYGVSFFSSRGPTGDGRMKPDLVAPGERIRSTLPGDQWGDLDGTSMAAPHVSGAAAMLMARYPELVGQPRRIKQILCDTATDLGREKSFQGRGMLDVLRAFQSV